MSAPRAWTGGVRRPVAIVAALGLGLAGAGSGCGADAPSSQVAATPPATAAAGAATTGAAAQAPATQAPATQAPTTHASTTQAPATQPPAATQAPAAGSQGATGPAASLPSGGSGRRPPSRTLPSGAVVTPPAAPTATAIEPVARCGRQTVDREGRDVVMVVPPTPGLQARLTGREIHIVLDTTGAPAACAPTFASLLVEDDTDPRQRFTHRLRLHSLGRRELVLALPPQIHGTPDTARATVGTDDGRLSETASVAIVTQ